MPNARIVYVSATGATTVHNLAYAQRLGLWGGEDFPFATRAEFVEAIEAGGVAAMEVLARDLKALGLYAARSLSYEGVEYELLEHRLTDEQIRIYDAYAGAFSIIHNNLDAAMEAANITGSTGTLNAQAKSAARSAFESAKQRFFNHLITAMKTPSLIASVERDLGAGHAAVIQIVSTGEALMERRLAEIPTEEWNDVQVDITPREYVLDYLAHSFPTQLFEPFTDSEGNLSSRPVYRDGQPVQCRKAVARRDRLIEKRIYTTNYDNAAEVSRSGKFPISSVTIDEPQSTAGIGSVVHLNGYIKRVSPANLEKELLLTDASYAASRLVETGWLSSFERDLTTSRAVIFAGYSLYDLEIDKVLLAADSISRKTFFFIAPDADDIEVSTLQRYGTVVPGGIDVLVNKIEEVTSDYTPPSFIGGFTSLRELSTPRNLDRKGSSAEKLTEQFVYGQLPENEILARSPIFGNQTFLVNRRQDDEANLTIRQGTWRDILFVGEIASGKSASTLTLAVYLLDQSYKVFYAVRGASLSADLRKLSGIQDKVAVVFDGYASFRKEIAEYAGCRPITHRIIMAERSAIHEIIDDFIGSTPQLGPVREVALDKIDAADAPAFEALVNFGGFWGERAGAGVITRQNYITREF